MVGDERTITARVVYRLRQFGRGLWAQIAAAERAEVRRLLAPACASLFERQPPDAQRHSLNVLATLWTQAPVPADLAAAALLHDAGKLAMVDPRTFRGGAFQLWLRGPLVLLEAFAPSTAAAWSSAEPESGWRYLLYVHREHPAIGAHMVREAGGSALTCWLIANHQNREAAGDDEATSLLRRLQWADNRN